MISSICVSDMVYEFFPYMIYFSITIVSTVVSFYVYGRLNPSINHIKVEANDAHGEINQETSKLTTLTQKKRVFSKKPNIKLKTPKVSILYGTVTGNSKMYSYKLQTTLSSITEVDVIEISTIDPEETLLKLASANMFAVLVLSTFTDGAPPPSVSWFYKWLEESATDFRFDKGSFNGLEYAVFGLGNSLYKEHYNVVGKQVDNWMEVLGAHRAVPLALGDDDSLEEDFNKWAELIVQFVTSTSKQTTLMPAMEQMESGTLDVEELGPALQRMRQQGQEEQAKATEREMLTPSLRKALSKQGYKLLGTHSAVKMCRWTKAMLRGRGGCYKHTFYGIESHRCMEATPSLACANKCVFCWRHHTNPVGTEWRWATDDPTMILDTALAAHYAMINEFKGVPGVLPDRLAEGLQAKHCALSLVGEPIMYPHINTFVQLLHDKHISSFLVTNAQFPDAISEMSPVTQLYVSVDASTKNTLKKIDRPLFSDFWERFIDSLKALSKKGQRTVYRLTLVKAWNFDELESYSHLVQLGKPDFIEVKGVTFCGGGDENSIKMENVPWHKEVVYFSSKLADLLPDYALASEHEHSNCVLIAHKKFLIDDKWWTWIDYDHFIKLVKRFYETGGKESFSAVDYMAQTPAWAVFGSAEQGFDPADTRWHRRSAAAGC